MAESRRHAGVVPRCVRLTAIVGGAVAASVALALGAVTLHFARTVVTPPPRRAEDVAVLSFDGAEGTITLAATPDSVLDGEYGFWFADAAGHARLGAIVRQTERTVTRRILGVDAGDLSVARRGRMGGWFYRHPGDLGVAFMNVSVPTAVGPAPAWLFPALGDRALGDRTVGDRAVGDRAVGDRAVGDRWVIQVHGRGVTRTEALRAVPVFHAAAFTSLLISYRNDGVAPSSVDARYALGDTEWEDVEAAMRFALDRGAGEIVLMGWSMGGAVVLQAATRSLLRSAIRGVVLESPVIDWVTALNYQAKAIGLPTVVTRGVYRLLGSRLGSRLTGQAQPIDLARLDFVRRAAELALPILVMHSDDDGFVPSSASRALARARPDIVTFEEFHRARHTKLWNYDRDRFNGAITRWLGALEGSSGRTTRRTRREGVAKA